MQKPNKLIIVLIQKIVKLIINPANLFDKA